MQQCVNSTPDVDGSSAQHSMHRAIEKKMLLVLRYAAIIAHTVIQCATALLHTGRHLQTSNVVPSNCDARDAQSIENGLPKAARF